MKKVLIVSFVLVASTLLGRDVKAASVLTVQPYDNFHRITVSPSTGGHFAVEFLTISLSNPSLKVYSLTGTSGTTCYNAPCAVKSLQRYVGEKHAFAGINGSYFCPRDYSTCGPAGNYYWAVFNARNRKYVNASQNRFNHGGAMLTFDSSKHWRFYADTGTYPYLPQLHGPAKVDPSASILTAAISNGPTLMNKGKYVLNPATLDSKSRYTKSNRSGVAIRGTRIYLMVARKATVEDLGRIQQKLGMTYGMNLDGGGSSAMWYRGGYKAGPGRDLPNALVFAE